MTLVAGGREGSGVHAGKRPGAFAAAVVAEAVAETVIRRQD